MNYAEIGYNIGYFGMPILLAFLVLRIVLRIVRKRGDAERAKRKARAEAEAAALNNANVFREMERANLLKAQYEPRGEMEKLEIFENPDDQPAEELTITEE
ncbi:MAG: hypothetical protein IIX77_03695 [Oscillospiraceae bacterium]|nr:hypothetical protein [Oscillospiraceae bacterium]